MMFAIHKLPVIRYIRLRPRLVIATIFGYFLWILLPDEWRNTTRLLVSWDSGICLYLALAITMMVHSNHDKIRSRAAIQDEGKIVILSLTTITALASLAAIIVELAYAKTLTGEAKWQHISLVGVTVFLSWTFMQTMFALHYAHEYYTAKGESSEGLEFPAKYVTPDYWDFVYFSFVIGTAAQTADINIKSRAIRKVVALHCVTVFFYNTTILALTVNIGASFF